MISKKKKKKKKKKVIAKIQSDFSAEIQNSNVFFRPKSSDLQKKKKKKKKKKVFAKIQGDFSSKISQVQTFQGGLFSHGGGLFSIFHTKSASKAQKTCDFAYFTSQWGGLEPPPPPPPGYATGNYYVWFSMKNLTKCNILKTFAFKNNEKFTDYN